MPDVDASEGSGAFGLAVVGWRCLGCIPDVDGVDDECGELDEDEPPELVSGGATGAGSGAGGATGGVRTLASAGGFAVVGPNGCNLGMDVQLY